MYYYVLGEFRDVLWGIELGYLFMVMNFSFLFLLGFVLVLW